MTCCFGGCECSTSANFGSGCAFSAGCVLFWDGCLLWESRYKPRHRVNITSISRVQPMEATQAPPLEGFSFFTVETFAKIYYFMVLDDAERARWLNAFNDVLASQRTEAHENRQMPEAADSVDHFLARPAEWDLQQRRVLNLRKILFSSVDCQDQFNKCVPLSAILLP